MATIPIKVTQTTVGRIYDLRAAELAIEETLRNQRIRRFATEGASDGVGRWQPLRWRKGKALADKGKLRDLTQFDTDRRPRSVRVTMTAAPAMALIANVHQFGTRRGKDIVPVRKRALFIPTNELGRRSFLDTSRGVRVGERGNRRGLGRQRRELVMSRDFILRKRIPATPDKDGRAIPPRPHFRITARNYQELVDNIVDSQRMF